MLNERIVKFVLSEPEIGQRCKLLLDDDIVISTSPVVDWFKHNNGDMVICTKNSVYRYYEGVGV